MAKQSTLTTQATQIELTAALERLIRNVDEARSAFYRMDLTEVSLKKALKPLLAAIAALREALPEIAARADFYQHTDLYFDGDDYEKEFSGPALLSMYVMMDGLALGTKHATFSTYENALNEFGKDLSDLTSHCRAWDWEHGVWTDDGLDHRA